MTVQALRRVLSAFAALRSRRNRPRHLACRGHGVLDQVPGYLFLGACPVGANPRTAADSHAADAIFDDGVIPTAVGCWLISLRDAHSPPRFGLMTFMVNCEFIRATPGRLVRCVI